MGEFSMATRIKQKMGHAAHTMGVVDPTPYVGELLERSFHMPVGDPRYAANTLTPGAVPVEPSYSEMEPQVLRFTIEPVGAGTSPSTRRDEATREMRRLVGPEFGRDALRWFDGRSEEWRGFASPARMNYGAWFGTSYDRHGLAGSKIYYELSPNQLHALPPSLAALLHIAAETMPNLRPLFTTIACRRDEGSQRLSFGHRGPLRIVELGPLLKRLNMEHQLPGFMQIIGLTLGGRFDLPEGAFLLGLGEAAEGAEVKLEIMLPMLPDLPAGFLDLLALGLAERPRELHALGRWLHAMTPETHEWPGEFSVLSVRATPHTSARVSLYLRPAEFEVPRRLADVRPLHGMALV